MDMRMETSRVGNTLSAENTHVQVDYSSILFVALFCKSFVVPNGATAKSLSWIQLGSVQDSPMDAVSRLRGDYNHRESVFE